jgi:26S proteasome regulatory subunit T5
MFIGDGAKLVRDCFALAKEKAPAIIFIDELDAVGTKRFDSEKSGDREVQRTMLELLNQLDGFASDDRIKVLAATNRVDVLDPALLRSGRLDRKIEFPLPNEEARAQILKIHSRKMKVDPGVNWGELARSTDEFGGAMLKAVCVEAGMIALRSGKNKIGHEHYVDAIAEVQAKKKDVSALVSPVWILPLLTRTRRLSTSTLKVFMDNPSCTGLLGTKGFVMEVETTIDTCINRHEQASVSAPNCEMLEVMVRLELVSAALAEAFSRRRISHKATSVWTSRGS